jgi:hypothetical protein
LTFGTLREQTGRRSLTHVGGEAVLRGDPGAAAVLRDAFDVPSSLEAESLARAHVHGFHTYAARLHPLVAARLVAKLSRPGEGVLDPFCGSGTVLVEARLAGRAAAGSDLNPLAVWLASFKAEGRGSAWGPAFLAAARRVADHAEERRVKRLGPTRRYGPDDLDAFDRHVLLALDGVRNGIRLEPSADLRDDLALVLSSILVKLARRAADTSSAVAPKRIAQTFPARLFVAKSEELVARVSEVAPMLHPGPRPILHEGDARNLRWLPAPAHLVVTSPPYPGVYDYHAHHALRLRWLGLDASAFEEGELGSKRGSDEPGGLAAAFERDVVAFLRAISSSLRPRGLAALVVGDGAFGPRVVRFDELLERRAPDVGLHFLASVSQPRPSFVARASDPYGPRGRFEHVVLLER